MKLFGSFGIRDRIRAANRGSALLYTLFILSTIPLSAVNAGSLTVDLGRISQQLEVRYFISEHGELPPGYILIGTTDEHVGFIRPGFLEAEFDLRKEVLEFDPGSGLVFKFRIPRTYRFLRREERRGAFYFYLPRDVSIPGMGIEINTLQIHNERINDRVRREVWIEEVKYNLQRAVEGRPGRGLLSLDIPIDLPDKIEAIIGKGEATNLNVSGREKISLRGESNWCANCPEFEGRSRQQKFPELDMEQQLTVDLHGTIGEKINVGIQHSSTGEALGSLNRVKINYTGFEDEIIKLIEMGDTDLTLRGASLIGYSGSAKGLFGVKAKAQVGPMDLTVIASKEEGETASGSFTSSGGAASQATVRDRSYIRRQWFYLENPGTTFDQLEPGFVSSFLNTYPIIDPDAVEPIEVYVSLRTDLREEQTYEGAIFYIDAYPDPANDGLDNDEGTQSNWPGIFKQLELGRDFELIRDFERDAYIGIWLFQPLDDKRALAVSYRATDGSRTFDVGNYGTTKGGSDADRRLAELVCPPSDEFGPDSKTSAYPSTWKMMMRNVYSLGMSQIDPDLLEVSIRDRSLRLTQDIVLDESGVSYLRVFGLDSYDQEGKEGKDGKIDNQQGILYPELGFLVFPWPEPFNPPQWVIEQILDPDDPRESLFRYDTLVTNSIIYDTLITSLNEDEAHAYEIAIEGSTGQRIFQLNAFDIIEGSEVVSVEGMGQLTRGVDYDIDYLLGTVTLKGERAAEIGDSRVNIDYQHKPLVGGGKSSLLGFSAEFNLSRNTQINGMFLYNSVGAPKYSPRLGEEPSRVMAADLNANFQTNPGWMTSLVNLLPRVDTNAESRVNFTGEIAVSFPNPNVKGEAFVDDMEGIEESSTVTLSRPSWYESGPLPSGIDLLVDDRVRPDSFYWYNPAQKDQVHLLTSKWDLNPNLDERERSSVSSLFLKSFDAGGDQWAGIMTGFPGGIDLTTSQYLEIWVNDFQPDSTLRGGVIHIDFGLIDEDFFEPGVDPYPNDERDEQLLTWDTSKDTGFRTEGNGFEGEPREYPYQFNNYDRTRDIYPNINARRNNSVHDTEDLNKNGRLDKTNAYYTLTLPLDSTAVIDVQRDYVDAGHYWNDKPDQDYPNRKKAWRMYRLNLSIADANLVSPTGVKPRLDAIQHIRIWVEGMGELQGQRGQTVEITGLKFVGNRWKFNGVRGRSGQLVTGDTTDVTIGVINNKDFDFYHPPYQVDIENGIENREQSLYFGFEKLADTTSFQAVKRFLGRGQDYQQYRELMFFLQADVDTFNADFYLRIAYDSMNYYEIGVPLQSLGRNRWRLVRVNLADLTNLKIGSIENEVSAPIRDAVDENIVYEARVIGSPSLFEVRYLYAGVRNRSGATMSRGFVFFNDLKLGGVRRDIDHAEGINFSANFANILTLGASWDRAGPEFRSLQRKRGTGETSSSLRLNGKTEVNHFIPTLGFTLPVSVRYGSTKALPKYIPRSDIEINESAVQDSLKSESKNYMINVSMSRGGSQNYLMRTLFDNLKSSFSYERRNGISPTSRDTTTTLRGNLNYQIRFRERTLPLFRGIKWRYWLTNFSYISAASRKERVYYSFSDNRFVRRPIDYSSGWNNEISVLYDPFESVKIDFGANEKRNLAVDHNFYGIPIGVRTSYRQSLLFQFRPGGSFPILNEFNPQFEYTASYSEDLNPSIRKTYFDHSGGERVEVRDPFGTRNVTGDRDINIVFDVDMGRYALWFGEFINVLREGERGKRRAATATGIQAADDFKKWLEDQKPKGSKKAGELELIPDLEQQPPPQQPTTPPTKPPDETEEDEQKKPDVQELGARRPDEQEEEPAEEGKPEEEQAAEADSAAVSKYDPKLLLKQIFLFLGRIEPIKTTIRMDNSTYYPRLHERAGIAYQLGLTDKANTPGARDTTVIMMNDPERASDNFTIDLHTGVAVTDNLDLDIRSTFRVGNTVISGSKSRTEDLTWPALTFNWKGLEQWGLLSRFVNQSDITARFERKYSKTVRREETNYQFSPTWNFTWKNTLTTNLAFTYNQRNWIEARQEMWSRSWSVNIDLRYSFEGSKGIGLPLPFLNKKKLTFKSRLDTSLNLSYSQNSSYKLKSSSVFAMTPQASYKFSNKIRGTLSMNYARTSGGQLGYIFHKLGLQVTLDFNF